MCVLYDDGRGTHWTEAGTDAGRAAEPETGRARYLGRLNRVALINRILDHYGCAASDWANNQYVVKSHAGRTAMVAHLPQIWAAAEEIAAGPSTRSTPPCSTRCAASRRVRRRHPRTE